MTTTKIPIFCFDCGAKGAVGKVTAGLQCRCGSTNLGLDGVDNEGAAGPGEDAVQPADEMNSRTSGLTMAAQQRLAAGGTGWTGPDSRRLDGWSEYQGPTPQVVHRNPPVAQENEGVCPTCHGIGRDNVDMSVCRECGGTGKAPMSPTGGPNPQYGESRDPGRALPAGGAHWSSFQGLSTEAQAKLAFNDGHVETYIAWAKSEGRDPDHAKTLKEYEKRPGIGRAHTNHIADQLYIGGGEDNWRQHKEGGRAAPGGIEEIIRSTTPGYGQRGDRGPRAGANVPFNPEDAETYYPSMPNKSPHVKTREDHDYDTSGRRPARGYDPDLGYTENRPYTLDMATCPYCGSRPTELVKDKNEDAWWHCPKCGPLANIDKRPDVNPYDPPQDFQPDRTMKTGGFLRRNLKTGRLLNMLAVIHTHNDITETEAVTLARESVMHYGEGR